MIKHLLTCDKCGKVICDVGLAHETHQEARDARERADKAQTFFGHLCPECFRKKMEPVGVYRAENFTPNNSDPV